MMGNFLTLVGRAAIDTLREQRLGHDIEKELNEQFSGYEWEFTNYEGDQVVLSIEAITVRPKYFPQEHGSGIQKVEADNLFTDLEKERTSPTFTERVSALVNKQWITVIRLNIQNGGADLIRPPGLNLSYVTATTALRSNDYDSAEDHPINPIPQIRVAKTPDFQSGKLEMKIGYDENIGDYTKRINDSIDLVANIQQEMDYHVMQYLFELHHSVYTVDNEVFSGSTAERVRDLGKYLFGHPVDLDVFEERIREVKETIEEDSSF